ncbi:hypothetical protein JTB14_005489 [Gonioctena quinquepunctata]|nr:hypothetical protein JTB14_005489 [Gonioctena quinquepunctata]
MHQKQVKYLEEENQEFEMEVENLERSTKNNIMIIFGSELQKQQYFTFICEYLNNILNIEITPRDVNSSYGLGKNTSNPFELKLISHLKKREILRKSVE